MGTFILYWLFSPHFLSPPFVGKPDIGSCPFTQFTVEKLPHNHLQCFQLWFWIFVFVCRFVCLFACFLCFFAHLCSSPEFCWQLTCVYMSECDRMNWLIIDVFPTWYIQNQGSSLKTYWNKVDTFALSPLSCPETELCMSWFRFRATGLKEIYMKRNTSVCF